MSRTIVNRMNAWCWSSGWLLIAAMVFGAQSVHAGPESSDGSIDHPLVVVSAASIDRLWDRAADVLRTYNPAADRAEVHARLCAVNYISKQESETSIKEVLEWIDTTKPVGVMVFYDASLDADEEHSGKQAENKESSELSARETRGDGMLELYMGLSESVDLTRAAMFFPVRHYEKFLANNKFTVDSSKPFCFRDESNNEIFFRRFGDYFVAADDPDLLEHIPDPREIVKPLLGKNDLVVSVQLKGLPPLLRGVGAEGIKAVFDASLQRRDNESDRSYQLRRAFGDLYRELLDLAVLQIDDVNVGIRLVPETRQFVAELDLKGPKDGKLARAAKEFSPRRAPFDELWNPGCELSVAISLGLPERHAKPIASAIRNYVSTATDSSEKQWLAGYGLLIESACKILDSRQLDLIVTGDGDLKTGTMLVGLRIPGGPQFPEQFQQFLEFLQRDSQIINGLEFATDSVHGWPAHGKSSRVLSGVFKSKFDWDVASSNPDQEENSWILATPNGIWLCANMDAQGKSIPDIFSKAVAQQTSPAKKSTAAGRVSSPVRLRFRTRSWKVSDENSPDRPLAEGGAKDENAELNAARVKQVAAEQTAERQRLYDEKSDAISVELQPSEFGWKLSVVLDEVYLALIAHEFYSVEQSTETGN